MARYSFFLLLATTLVTAATPGELIDAGHYLRVKALVEPLVQANPEDAESIYYLSRAEGALGNLDLSLKLAEKTVALSDGNASYHVQLAAACGRLAQTSSLIKQLGYAKRAKKELDVALALDQKNLDALYGLALFYYAAPTFVGGDKVKAQAAADAMVQLDPARGYLTDAKLANEKKDAAAEEDFYKKAIAAKPDYYDSHASLAAFYILHSRISEANEEASQAINLDPARAEAWKVLAQIQVATQCWDELLEILKTARQAVPDDLGPYYSAALALEDSGHFVSWASEFVATYMSLPPEGNEPTLLEVAKTAKRLKAAML